MFFSVITNNRETSTSSKVELNLFSSVALSKAKELILNLSDVRFPYARTFVRVLVRHLHVNLGKNGRLLYLQ